MHCSSDATAISTSWVAKMQVLLELLSAQALFICSVALATAMISGLQSAEAALAVTHRAKASIRDFMFIQGLD